MISISIISDTKTFSELRDEWNELLGASAQDNVFLTWEWLFTWWEHLGHGRRLRIITLREDGQLIALAPLMQTSKRFLGIFRFRVLQFLGSGDVGSDFLNIIFRRGYEAPAVQCLSDHFAGNKIYLGLNRLDNKDPLLNRLADHLAELGWRSVKTSHEVCPYTSLAGQDWESFVTGLGKSHRFNVRKRIRKLGKAFTDVRLEQAGGEAQCRDLLDTLIDLHLLRWRHDGGSTAFHKQELIRFHHAMAPLAERMGWLRLFVLRLDGRPAALVYCLSYGNKYYYYQAGYDTAYSQYSIGLVCTALAIKRAIEEGAGEFDFLHGDEGYKSLWTSDRRELARLDLFPPNIRGCLWRQASGLYWRAKRTFWRDGLNPYLNRIR